MTKQIVMVIERRGGIISGEVHSPDGVWTIDDARLGPTDRLNGRVSTQTLDDVVSRIARFRRDDPKTRFTDSELYDIGTHLYATTIGCIPRVHRPRSDVDLRIVTDDEFLGHLPWPTLAEAEDFLSATRNWAISFSVLPSESADHILPPSPKILIIAPQPPGWPSTEGEQHVDELVALLGAANPLHCIGGNLFVVHDWEQTVAALDAFQPDMIYFYGHGIGNHMSSSLVFAANTSNGTTEAKVVPAVDFKDCLRSACKRPPSLVYVNCCMGEAGGVLGVGRQLSSFIPAVVTNCTSAYIQAARAQALTFWREALIEGAAPHEAVAAVRRAAVVDHGLTLADFRWLVPTLRVRYRNWNFQPPGREGRDRDDVNWEHKLDRTHQFGQVLYRTRMLLEQDRYRLLACVWYGRKGQGLQQFHERLHLELPAHVEGFECHRLKPHWPEQWLDFRKTAGGMLAHALGAGNAGEIAQKIAATYGTEKNILLYVDHTTLALDEDEEKNLFNVKRLRDYFDWLDQSFARYLPANVVALFGISFVTPSPEKFRNDFVGEGGIIEIEFDRLRVELLAEMKSLEWEDLLDFIRTHEVVWPRDAHRRRQLFNDLVSKTDGVYEEILPAILAVDPYQ